jgi:hypothetical protein
MLLLIGVSVGLALSLLTSNNFYSEKTFTSSANHALCNEIKREGCPRLIAQASDLPLNGWQSHNGGGIGSSRRQSFWGRMWGGISNFWERAWSVVSNFFRHLF